MFVVTVVFEIERDAVEIFLKRVKQQAVDSLTLEPGCKHFDVCHDVKSSNHVLLYELYDDADAFATHLASDHFRAFETDASPHVRSKKIQSWSLVE